MLQDPGDKPGDVGGASADGQVIQRKDHERHSDGTISIVPPAVVQTGGLPPACPMDIPIRHSEDTTPHPDLAAADADLDQGLATGLGRPDHHHRRPGLCNGHHPASPAVYIRAASSPSREAHGGEASTDLSLDLGVVISKKTPVDFHFGSAVTAFTAGDKSGVVASPTSPLRTSLPSKSSAGATRRRTIADRTAQKQAQADKMLFSDLYKSPKSPLSKLRNSLPHPVPVVSSSPDYDADLLSRDKAKNKEAVRRFLAEKIRNDWDFEWPLPTVTAEGITTSSADDSTKKADDVVEAPATDVVASVSAKVPFSFNTVPNAGAKEGASNPTETDGEVIAKDSGDEADSESDTESIYSIVSEDAVHFRPRAEWTSDLSDVETMQGATSPKPVLSPFRFDSPDSVGAAVLSKVQTKRAKRRRALRDEVAWNDGLACFVARRDAWTGAKTVRVRPKTTAPSATSPTSGRRLSFWRTTSHTRRESSSSQPGTPHLPLTATISAPAAPPGNPLSPTTTNTSSDSESPPSYPIETLLPLAPPLIPPANTMRASIVPSMYANIYDKVVAHSMQPSCPINLSDMIRSCVVGWKRDGEWPPRAAPPEVMAVRRPKSAASRPEHSRTMSFVAGFGLLRGRSSEEKEKGGLEKEIGGKDGVKEGGNGGKGIRRSLQRAFSGLGGHHDGEHHVVAA